MCGSMAHIQYATIDNRRGKEEKLECGPMRTVMVALRIIGGTLSLFNAAKFG